jgi:hypothetical protein
LQYFPLQSYTGPSALQYFPLQSYNGLCLAFYTFYCNSNMESVNIYFG